MFQQPQNQTLLSTNLQVSAMIKPISMHTNSQPVTTTNQLKGTIIPSPILKNSNMSHIDMSVND